MGDTKFNSKCGENGELELNDNLIREYAILDRMRLSIVLDKVSRILDNEPKLIKVPKSRLYIIGDTHGNLPMVIHAFKHLCPMSSESHTKFDKIILN